MKAAIIQARMGSTRLPGKVLLKIEDKTLIEHVIERLKKCENIDKIIVASTTNKKDDELVNFLEKKNINTFRGSEENVLNRYVECAKEYNADLIVRVTSDDPLIDPYNIDRMIYEHEKNNADLVYTKDMPLGTGLGMIVISKEALEESDKKAKIHRHKEQVDEYVLDHPKDFKIIALPCKENLKFNCRLTVDQKEDLKFMREIYRHLYKKDNIVKLKEVIELLKKKPELMKINNKVNQLS